MLLLADGFRFIAGIGLAALGGWQIWLSLRRSRWVAWQKTAIWIAYGLLVGVLAVGLAWGLKS